jgi:hypothetical protein
LDNQILISRKLILISRRSNGILEAQPHPHRHSVDGAREREWSCSKQGCSQDFWKELHIDVSSYCGRRLHSAGIFRNGATRPTWIMSDQLLRQAFNLRHFSPGELAFLQIVNCPLLIQIKSLGRSRIEAQRIVPDASVRHVR